MEPLERAEAFLYRNARPLDLARWNLMTGKAAPQAVFDCLRAYQNPDGGFGHALEPDSWNPGSTPLQTWAAANILRETALPDKSHPLIAGITAYLSSGAAFDGHRWRGLNTVASNDDFPHAPWWSCTGAQETSYHPTASLAGFLLRCAGASSPARAMACRLAQEAFGYFRQNFPLASMHETACFVELYEDLKACGIRDLLDLEEFRALLRRQIQAVITWDTAAWRTDYVCKPSLFIRSRESDFYPGCEDICRRECDFIRGTQNADGTWDVTWRWDEYPDQWAISKNWWKSDIILRNTAFLRAMEG
jgi:hypothetical protein